MIVLLESDNINLDRIVSIANSYDIESMNTRGCTEEEEYDEILERVETFSSDEFSQILFINFSGRDSVARFIGDEFSDMVIVMSCNKLSEYYTECPVSTFLDLINSIEKEQIST